MNPDPGIRSEEALLLSLCRLTLTDESTARIRSLCPGVTDWNYFGNLTARHGVDALVYRNLGKAGLLQDIPSAVAERLRNAMMISLSRNISHSLMMGDVLEMLNGKNIKTILLKGLALELSEYGNTGVRQMSDIDILIRKEQCLEARDILLRNGFRSLPVKSVLHRPILSSIGKHLPTLIKNGVSVEIHTELFGAKARGLTDVLINKSYEIDLEGQKAFIPQPALFFLYLVRHLFLHELKRESQLRLYTDLAVLINHHRDEIFDPGLLVYAGEAGLEKILSRKLELLRIFWDIDLPEWMNDLTARHHDPSTANSFIFFLKNPGDNILPDNSASYRQAVSDIPGFHRKLLYIAGDILPTISFMKKRYRCRSTFRALLHYPLRLGKLYYLVHHPRPEGRSQESGLVAPHPRPEGRG
jgi:hypothetical protein